MTFSETSKVKIRIAIGHGGLNRDDRQLESRINAIGSFPESQELVEQLLLDIDGVKQKLRTRALVTVGVKMGSEDVELFAGGHIRDLHRLGRQYCNELAIFLGYESVIRDIFSEGPVSEYIGLG